MRQSRLFLDSLVEGDPVAASQARRNRVVSLGLSVATQTLLLVAALVVPLVVTAERPRAMLLTPGLPYYNVRAADAQPAGPRAPNERPLRHPIPRQNGVLFQPPRIPATVADIHDEVGVNLPPGVIAIPSGDPRGLVPGLPDVFAPGPQPPLPDLAAKKPSAPVRKSEGVQEALLVHRVTPEYPILARQARIEGKVVLRAIIGRDGTIRDLSVVEGQPLLARAAMQAVQQWRYQPTLLSGEPMEVDTQVTIIFKLQR